MKGDGFTAFAAAQMRGAGRTARRLRLPRHDAEDMLQELLLRLWQERSAVDVSRWPGWMSRGLRFGQLKRWRAGRRAAAFEGAFGPIAEHEAADPPEVMLHQAECEAVLFALVASLPPALGEVARMHLVEEMPLAEVALRMGIPENTTKDRWRRAREGMHAAWERGRLKDMRD